LPGAPGPPPDVPIALAGQLEHVDVACVIAHVHETVGVELDEVRAQHLVLRRQVVTGDDDLADVGGRVPANHPRVLHVADVEPRLARIPGDAPGLGQALAVTARLRGRGRVGGQVPHADAVV